MLALLTCMLDDGDQNLTLYLLVVVTGHLFGDG
jgi:hypothetical protein